MRRPITWCRSRKPRISRPLDPRHRQTPRELLPVPGHQSDPALDRQLQVDGVRAAGSGGRGDRGGAPAALGVEVDQLDPAMLVEGCQGLVGQLPITGQAAERRRHLDPQQGRRGDSLRLAEGFLEPAAASPMMPVTGVKQGNPHAGVDDRHGKGYLRWLETAAAAERRPAARATRPASSSRAASERRARSTRSTLASAAVQGRSTATGSPRLVTTYGSSVSRTL